MSETGDRHHMVRALQLARRGLYGTDPNPRVGCVLVRDGNVIGEGWHERAGGPHAEIRALEQAGERARGADCYVTLAPCNSSGRTGPCSVALIGAGVARVVVAMDDPNPAMEGGLERLSKAGIRVSSGLLGEQAAALNQGFLSRLTRGRPFCRLKIAASIDGRTALADGTSQWITGGPSRADVQRLRARASAVLTGIGTVLADDPRLDVRIETPRQPARVILDGAFRTPPGARLFDSGGPVHVFGAEGREAPEELATRARIEHVARTAGGLDLDAVMGRLAELEVNELHVEAGPTLTGALMAAGLVDELVLYQAPVMLGHEGRPLAVLPGIDRMDRRGEWRLVDERRVGGDVRMTLRPVV